MKFTLSWLKDHLVTEATVDALAEALTDPHTLARDMVRTVLRDSLFRDIIDTLNPFSNSVRNIGAP